MLLDRTNIVGAERTGPFQPWKVIGPPHLSLRDRGITFGTNSSAGVCLRPFRDLVCAMPPYVVSDDELVSLVAGITAAVGAG